MGRPVVPEVKRSAAGSSSSRSTISTCGSPSGGSGRSTHAFGVAASSPRVDLGLRQQDVERHRDRSEAENAEVGGDVVGRVRQLDRDAVVGLDALRTQRCGGDGGPAVELAVRDPLVLEQQRRPLGMLGGRRPRGRARDSRAPQPPGDKRLRRSHRYFFFVKAGPKSGLTWQFWILPAHIESSWRP